MKSTNLGNNNPWCFFSSIQNIFVLAFDDADGSADKVERSSDRKYFFPRVNITSYNVLIDGRVFGDQLIDDQIKQYCEIREIATRQGLHNQMFFRLSILQRPLPINCS